MAWRNVDRAVKAIMLGWINLGKYRYDFWNFLNWKSKLKRKNNYYNLSNNYIAFLFTQPLIIILYIYFAHYSRILFKQNLEIPKIKVKIIIQIKSKTSPFTNSIFRMIRRKKRKEEKNTLPLLRFHPIGREERRGSLDRSCGSRIHGRKSEG